MKKYGIIPPGQQSIVSKEVGVRIHIKSKPLWSAGITLLFLIPAVVSCAMATASSKTDIEKRLGELVQSNRELEKRVDELERKFRLLESALPTTQPAQNSSSASAPPSVASSASPSSHASSAPAAGTKSPGALPPPSGMPVLKLRPPNPSQGSENPSGAAPGSSSGEAPPPLYAEEPGSPPAPGEGTGEPGPTPPPVGSPSHPPVTGGLSVEAVTLYESATGQYEKGKYELAIEAFQLYLTKYPDSSYAPGAMFYLGECFYQLHRYPLATENYRRMLMKYPENQRAPDALYKLGMCLLQVNDFASAKQAFNRVIEQYPNSEAAKSAQAELKKMQ